ncbi:SET domain-containing protein-lysine N-methyltransferase [Sulfitobacter donghicola]|uniref:SET domain-containing protein n=1 Tax=Sulfitobacter donghicola DSW-25 = KCTC 12864 = JCM 14565 TaxID=1300350 RepID=A0A073IU18_9RHOB|nr:SET domain-containing protein [Sulfitobacter donghicola]KEJ88897.1 hypothetical protein DSW25_14585 [Sulfitobacter donghicola DSW-25 = KCTC 12864 = JCM 14565]KIN68666.1 Nuclear protein SET [Sulfitobacter donghicola DSW-25 = KCTC 12864 = JCM 14565]
MPTFIQTIPETVKGASAYNGDGLFTRVKRTKGEILCHLDGQIIDHKEDFDLLSTQEWNALDDTLILLRDQPTSYYLINHSKTPNLTIDPKTYALVAKNDIPAGDELLLDYLENGFPQKYLMSDRCAYLR